MAEIGIGGQRTDAMSDDAESPVRVAPSRRVAEEWALVLATAGIEARMQPEDGRWVVSVPDAQAERAAVTLAAYDGDRAHADDEPEPPQSEAGVVLSAVIVAIYAATGPRHAWTEAFRRGSAVGERIVAGEWWRAVTALTLHADAAHILGNAFIGLLFTTPVCRFLGPGSGRRSSSRRGRGEPDRRRRPPHREHLGRRVHGHLRRGRHPLRAGRRAGGAPADDRAAAVDPTGGRPGAARPPRHQRAGRSPRARDGFVVGLPLGAMTAGTPRPGRLAQAALAAASALLVAGSWWLALR
jgi:hypothetical protein